MEAVSGARQWPRVVTVRTWQQWPASLYREVQMEIGGAMRLQHELPEELPDQLLALVASDFIAADL